MSNPKFTPGPWTTEKQSIKDAHGRWIATCIDIEAERGVIDGNKNEDYANAALIAAAPDLYEACRQAIIALEGGCETEDDRATLVVDLKRAIARAEGKE